MYGRGALSDPQGYFRAEFPRGGVAAVALPRMAVGCGCRRGPVCPEAAASGGTTPAPVLARARVRSAQPVSQRACGIAPPLRYEPSRRAGGGRMLGGFLSEGQRRSYWRSPANPPRSSSPAASTSTARIYARSAAVAGSTTSKNTSQGRPGGPKPSSSRYSLTPRPPSDLRAAISLAKEPLARRRAVRSCCVKPTEKD